jgi:hypothetical protein
VIRDYLRRARALLFPGEEDFGIVPLEAQACGCPVIGFGRGGLTETVRLLGDRIRPHRSVLRGADGGRGRGGDRAVRAARRPLRPARGPPAGGAVPQGPVRGRELFGFLDRVLRGTAPERLAA